jgi:glucose/mannose transport system permease protein
MPDESPTKAMYHSPGALFGRVVIYSMLIIAAIYFLIPLLVMIITSLKTMGDIRTGSPGPAK